jgi:hypothetical protein
MTRDYSEFARLKDDLTYAAITRSFAGDGNIYWNGTAEGGFSSSYADQDIPGVHGDCRRDMVIRMTDENGASWELEVNPWRDLYEPWITRIDQALDGFHDLPEPAVFDGPIGDFYEAAGRLTASPVDAKTGQPTDADIGSVVLGTSISYIYRWFGPDLPDAYNSATVRAFDDLYGGARIAFVTQNQRTAALAAGLILVAEKQIWEHARSNIMDVMEKAKRAFDYGGDTGAVLTVVKAFIDLAAGFVPAGGAVAKGIGQVATSTGFLKEMLPKALPEQENSELSAATAEAIAGKFDDALLKLKRQIFETEAEVHASSDRMLDIMFDNAEKFHIHPTSGVAPEVGSAPTGSVANEIHADLAVFKEVGYRELPEIAAELGGAAQEATAGSADMPWRRPANIGWGETGVHYKWKELVDALVAVTTGTGNELVIAGQKLAAAAGYLHDSDGWSEKALKGVEKEIAGGSTDFSEPTPEPPGPPNYPTYK